MTRNREIIDVVDIERRAQRMRAEALAAATRSAIAWVRQMFQASAHSGKSKAV